MNAKETHTVFLHTSVPFSPARKAGKSALRCPFRRALAPRRGAQPLFAPPKNHRTRPPRQTGAYPTLTPQRGGGYSCTDKGILRASPRLRLCDKPPLPLRLPRRDLPPGFDGCCAVRRAAKAAVLGGSALWRCAYSIDTPPRYDSLRRGRGAHCAPFH